MNETDISVERTDVPHERRSAAEPATTGPRGPRGGEGAKRRAAQWARRLWTAFWLTGDEARRKEVPEPTAARFAAAVEATREDMWAAGHLLGLGLRRPAQRLQQLALERLDAGMDEAATLNLTRAQPSPALAARAALIRERVRQLEPLAESPSALRARRIRRSLTLLLVVMGTPLLLWKIWQSPKAEASSYFGRYPFLSPDKAIDNDRSTEWLLENGQLGWLDVRFPSRRIRHVRWINSKNIAADPRATKDFRIELWHKDRLVKGVDGTAAFSPDPAWTVVDVEGRGVDRIRFVVKSFHNSGGGVAELAWD